MGYNDYDTLEFDLYESYISSMDCKVYTGDANNHQPVKIEATANLVSEHEMLMAETKVDDQPLLIQVLPVKNQPNQIQIRLFFKSQIFMESILYPGSREFFESLEQSNNYPKAELTQ